MLRSGGFGDEAQFDALAAGWDRYSAGYINELVQLVGSWLAPGGEPRSRRLSILHFGSSSGAILRAMHEGLNHLADIELHGVDSDVRALAFLKAKLPAAHLHHADLEEFTRRLEETSMTVDVAIVALQCYALDEETVAKIISTLARVAPRVIIADQIENSGGDRAEVMSLKDYTGREYDSYCHAFGKLAASAGLAACRTFPTEWPVKSISGFVAAGTAQTIAEIDGQARLASCSKLAGLVPGQQEESSTNLLNVPTLMAYLSEHKLSAMDVGAAGGLHALWRPYGAVIEVDAFEPDAKACEAARAASAPNIHWHPVALDRATGKRPFHLLAAPTGSSFYEPNGEVQRFLNTSKYRNIDRTFDVQTWSVTDFLKEFSRPVPNLIKLDTQGSEFDILSSISDTDWDQVLAIEAEVEFIEVYKAQPEFADLDRLLRSKGMLLFDLRTAREYCAAQDADRYYMREHLNFAVGRNDMSARLYAGDALYFRDFCTAPLPSRTFVMKMLAALLIYSYYDYALFLCDRALEAKLIDASEHATLFAEIRTAAPKPKRWQRADSEGAELRSKRSSSDWQDHIYRAFWQVRDWPNQ